MYIIDKLLGYARLNKSEEKNFRLLFLQTLLYGFGTSFYLVVVSSYFIKKTSIASLPSGYIYSGLAGFLITALYKRSMKRGGAAKGYSAVLMSFGILSVVLFACRLIFPDSSPVSLYVAYIGFMGISPYFAIIALGFSRITLKVFNLSQSKRLLALVGTGEVFASFVAYLTVPLLTKLLGGATPLLLISAGASFFAIISLKQISSHNKEKLENFTEEKNAKKIDIRLLFKNEFYLLFAVVTMLSIFAVYFVDFSFLLSVRYVAADSGVETAKVVASVFCVIKLGELIFSILSRGIVSAQGMRFILLLQPVVLLGATIFAVVFGFAFAEVPLFVIVFLLFNKWAIRVISKAFTAPAMKVLYMVTDVADREQLQTTIDGTLNQYGTILAGIQLLIISLCFGHMDVIPFLKLVSVACVLFFAVWVFFTARLFTNYKLKIRDYLHHLLSNGSEHINAEDENSVLGDAPMHHPLVLKAMDKAPLSREVIDQYISFYNPSIKSVIPDDAFTFSVLKRAYYHNENFFSRLLIIWHTRSQSLKARLGFVKEFYSISELQLKIQMMKMLNEDGFKPEHNDVYFFTSLCEEAVREIAWSESTVNDVSETVDQKLTDALLEHTLIQQNLLFELLKVLYDSESIIAIQDVVNSKDKSFENKVFAVELLDNTLDTNMKKLIIPLFEDISFGAKKEKLGKLLLVYSLPCNDRLKEILMTNFMTVSPYIKQLAMQEYFRLTNDAVFLAACSSSNLENISSTAGMLLNNVGEPTFLNKVNAIEDAHLNGLLSASLIDHFAKWGLFPKQKNAMLVRNAAKQVFQNNDEHIGFITSPGGVLAFDTLGLSLMLQM